MLLPLQVARKFVTLLELRFPVSRQSVPFSKANWSIVMVLIVPIVCDLLVVVVEPRMVLAVLIVPILSAILCQTHTTSKCKKDRRTNNYPPACLHRVLRWTKV